MYLRYVIGSEIKTDSIGYTSNIAEICEDIIQKGGRPLIILKSNCVYCTCGLKEGVRDIDSQPCDKCEAGASYRKFLDEGRALSKRKWENKD